MFQWIQQVVEYAETGYKRKKQLFVPVDFAINWNSLGGSSSRLRYISGALSDMALARGEVNIIVGIAVSGIPFATLIADFIELEKKI